jgi:hypothetical protein
MSTNPQTGHCSWSPDFKAGKKKPNFIEVAEEGLADLLKLRSICLKIHSARIAMNEKAVIEGLNELDGYFREGNEN